MLNGSNSENSNLVNNEHLFKSKFFLNSYYNTLFDIMQDKKAQIINCNSRFRLEFVLKYALKLLIKKTDKPKKPSVLTSIFFKLCLP